MDAVAHTKEDKIGLKRALNIIYDGAVKCGIWKENISSKVLVTARSTTEKADKNLKTRIFTLEELRKLKAKGVVIRILEIPSTLTVLNDETPQNKLMIEMMNNMLIEMYTTFAQLELEKIRTRTKEALAVKKQKGEKLGRPRIEFPSNWKKVYKQYKNRDITGAQAMKLLDLKKTTFYKLVKEFEELLDLE